MTFLTLLGKGQGVAVKPRVTQLIVKSRRAPKRPGAVMALAIASTVAITEVTGTFGGTLPMLTGSAAGSVSQTPDGAHVVRPRAIVRRQHAGSVTAIRSAGTSGTGVLGGMLPMLTGAMAGTVPIDGTFGGSLPILSGGVAGSGPTPPAIVGAHVVRPRAIIRRGHPGSVVSLAVLSYAGPPSPQDGTFGGALPMLTGGVAGFVDEAAPAGSMLVQPRLANPPARRPGSVTVLRAASANPPGPVDGTFGGTLPMLVGHLGGPAVAGSQLSVVRPRSGVRRGHPGSVISFAIVSTPAPLAPNSGTFAGTLPKLTGGLTGAVEETAPPGPILVRPRLAPKRHAGRIIVRRTPPLAFTGVVGVFAGRLPMLTGAATATVTGVTGSFAGSLPKLTGSLSGGPAASPQNSGAVRGILPMIRGSLRGKVRHIPRAFVTRTLTRPSSGSGPATPILGGAPRVAAEPITRGPRPYSATGTPWPGPGDLDEGE